MATVIRGRESKGAGVARAFGDAAEKFIQSQSESYKKISDEKAIRGALEKLPPDAAPRQVLEAITGIHTYSPERKQEAVQNYLKSYEMEGKYKEAIEKQNVKQEKYKAKQLEVAAKQEKEAAEDKRRKESVKNLALSAGDDEEEAEKKSQSMSESAAVSYFREKQRESGREPKQSIFDKELEKGLVKSYLQAQEEIPKLEGSLKEIDELEKMTNKLTGLGGAARGIIGSSEATEFNARAIATMQPFLKVINPVGAIPVAKINILMDRVVPKAWERQEIQLGKLRAGKAIVSQALARNKAKVALFEQYRNKPPAEAVKKFDEETTQMFDAIIDTHLDKDTEDLNIPMDPVENKGRIITNPETGIRAQSNGTKWVRI